MREVTDVKMEDSRPLEPHHEQANIDHDHIHGLNQFSSPSSGLKRYNDMGKMSQDRIRL